MEDLEDKIHKPEHEEHEVQVARLRDSLQYGRQEGVVQHELLLSSKKEPL